MPARIWSALPLGSAVAVVLACIYDLVRGRVRVRGASMAPTLLPGDLLLTSRLLLYLQPLRRGDIVALSLNQPDAPDRLDLKRVVGLPNERVALQGGRVLINGTRLAEPYVELPDDAKADGEWFVGVGQFFVMGDNRGWSTDSRRYGPIATTTVVAKVWWRTGPGERWGRV